MTKLFCDCCGTLIWTQPGQTTESAVSVSFNNRGLEVCRSCAVDLWNQAAAHLRSEVEGPYSDWALHNLP